MPTSATGSNLKTQTMRFRNVAYSAPARGFTLLEIALVLVILSVILAVVVPNLMQDSTSRLADEGRYLKQILRLAKQESALSGLPVRWTGFKDEYHFSLPGDDHSWQVMDQRPFASHQLPEGLHINRVEILGGTNLHSTDANEKKQTGLLGHVLFYPDGISSLADIELAAGAQTLSLNVRPGPGGISVEATGK